MYRLILILLIVISESFGQYFIKKYDKIPLYYYYGYGIFFYLIVIYLLTKVYKNSDMGVVQLLWSGLSVVTVLMVGHFLFGEEIHGNEWVGIILILSGVLITQVDKKTELWLTNSFKHEYDVIKKYLS